ncbi:MAG: hypothetical protein EWV62_03225 [Microcystis aeruginosa Ma_OC_LR_19540900_S633]|nr:MAG: hypothetical protein EWV62_03225 [Microcystis aeruginosa Ma_OC_LR_19540900_S633]
MLVYHSLICATNPKTSANVPFGRTQFAPTLWTKSVTVGAQSLRPPINWDIIPTQVPYCRSARNLRPPLDQVC